MHQNATELKSSGMHRGSVVTPYVATWGGLALLALTYISITLAHPDTFASPNEMPATVSQSQNTDSDNSQAMSLEDKLARMERDLQKTGDGNVGHLQHRQAHLDRIAALEAKAAKAEAERAADAAEQVDGTEAQDTATKQAADEIADRIGGTKILNDPDAAASTAEAAPGDNLTTLAKATEPDQATAEPPSQQPQAAQAKSAPPETATQIEKQPAKPPSQKVAAEPPAPPEKKIAAAEPKAAPPTPAKKKPRPKAEKKIQTGSVGKAATQPITFGPATVTPASLPIGVRLATGPSVDSLRLSWTALADRHGPTLRQLQPRYVTGIGATGLTYDLIAGPFATQAEATEVCARLHANGARCALGEFTGNAL